MMQQFFIKTIVLVLCIHTQLSYEKTAEDYICPLGFSLSYTKEDAKPICFRRKGPEPFSDKYKDCNNNLFTVELYQDLNISKPDFTFWTDYKTFYPGGLFVKGSLSEKNYLQELETSLDVSLKGSLDLRDELCVVIDPVSNFTAVRCNERHYRYCFVEPYSDGVETDGCEGLLNGKRFQSPEPTCLTVLTGVEGGAVRATWSQSQKLCQKKGGSLLNRGWRYVNSPMLYSEGSKMYPLAMVMSTDYASLRYDLEYDHSEIPITEWNFPSNIDKNPDTIFGSLRNGSWNLVNSTHVFFDVICERSIQMKNISMEVSINFGEITLTVANMEEDYVFIDSILCFTDSEIRYPTEVKIRRRGKTNTFVLKPKKDGYYWCTHTDTMKYNRVESNKVLFIREKNSTVNTYAVVLKEKEKYSLNNVAKLKKDVWEHKLGEYIYYKEKYTKTSPEPSEEELQRFKLNNPTVERRIRKMSVKRLYLDGRTALVHVELSPGARPVSPGSWNGLEIVSMKPVLFCKGVDSIGTSILGTQVDSFDCRTYSCVGNFNEGVQWIITVTSNCTARNAPIAFATTLAAGFNVSSSTTNLTTYDGSQSSSSEEIEFPTNTTTPYTNTTEASTNQISTASMNTTSTTEITTEYVSSNTEPVTTKSGADTSPTITSVDLPPTSKKPPPKPTTTTSTITPPTTLPPTTTPSTPRPPEEKLQQVLDDLDRLVNNDTEPLLVENITEVFDQVDVILEENDDLEIPSQLLHLLDQLGSTITLETESATAVRSNIALLVADASPNHPVRGIRIASTNTDVFTETAFEFISQEPDSSVLNADESEVVVHLPSSVSESERRVSFVVFRNDRAFRENVYSVNSRVLSVNIENTTHFEHGEVIDIHLSPLISQPERNRSRACAYWHFLENGTGFWSQEGCTFIRASRQGMLDTCRCDHLTHFAEVLVPRTVFSERDENILEVLTIIGCCLSMLGLTLVAVTALMFRAWRRDYSNKIWLQLCVAIFIVMLSFTIVIAAKFDHYNVPCMLIGIALHYSVLASFCWMLVAAVLSYRRLVLVFARDASHKLLKASAFAWGLPSAIVGILLSVAPHSYAGRFEEKSPSGSFCYPSDLALWLTVYAPIAIILLANWILFILIVRSVFASRGIQRHGDTNEALRCASVSCLLVFLFGLPWIFGLFAYNVVAAYFFTLFATYQGFMLFLFFVLGNKKTRDLWLNKLKIKQTRKIPVTSSTYSNRTDRSMGWRNQAVTLESRVSKPKSLSSQDDSRFS